MPRHALRMRIARAVTISMVAASVQTGMLYAQSRHTQHTLTLDSASAPPPATLADVAWLQGYWRGTGLGGVAEESWLPPKGGAMLGTFRALREGEVSFYEIFVILEHEGSLELRLKHFNADLTGWEEKDGFVTFPLVRIDPDAVYFDGLTYRREGEDRMRTWVVARQRDGGLGEFEFEYEKVGH